jgi:hypothetical protein
MISKLVLINDIVKDINFIIENLSPDVTYVILNYKDTIDIVIQKLSLLDLSDITHIGLIFDNISGRAQFIEYTQLELDADITLKQSIVDKISTINTTYDIKNLENIKTYNINDSISIIEDNDITPIFYTSTNFFSDGFLTVINEIKKTATQLNIIDIISCQIKYHSQFITIDGINIRYSSNLIGINYGWELNMVGENILSSSITLIDLYFTNNITDYQYTLGAVVPLVDGFGNYLINNADNLLWLMTYTSNTGVLPNLSSTFKITADIDMNNQTAPTGLTESIGKTITTGRFIGQLIGDNKTVTIRGIDFTNPVSGPLYTGFFGHFGTIPPGGTAITGNVENLNIIYTTNTFTYNTSSPSFTGLLCGIARSGTINNCTVSFDNNNPVIINYTSSTGASVNDIGGLIGRRQAMTIINNCRLNISGDLTINVSAFTTANVGGLCGTSLSAGTTSPGTPQIGIFNTNIIIVGNLTINAIINNIGGGSIFIGGYTGIIQNNVLVPITDILYTNNSNINCKSLLIQDISTLTTNANATRRIGGFCGFLFGNCQIDTCNVDIDNIIINTSQHRNKYIGGFCGSHQSLNTINIFTRIINSNLKLNNLSILYNNNISGYVGSFGGFVGNAISLNANISNCNFNVSSSMNITSTSLLTGNFFDIGGVIGSSNTNSQYSNITSNITSLYININNINKVDFLSIGAFTGYITNVPLLTNCNTTIGTLSVTNSASNNVTYFGGMYGDIVGNSNISNNTMNINKLSVILRGIITFIGGLAGSITNTSSVQNCNINIGENTFIQSITPNNITSIGGLIGRSLSTGTILNNNITYGNFLTFKANNSSTSILLNNIIGFSLIPFSDTNIVTFVRYPLLFNSILNGSGIDVQGTNYLIQPSSIVTINVNEYNIDLSEAITLFIYLIRPIINIIPPCCVANVCDANPQTANYNNQNIVHNASGGQLVTAVSNFYAAAAAGQARPNAPPIFKTYGQMMDWKQRQNRR